MSDRCPVCAGDGPHLAEAAEGIRSGRLRVLYMADEADRAEYARLSAMPCNDCGIDTSPFEVYMLHDVVWDATGLGPDGGYLCIGCCEARLGRRLARADFDFAAGSLQSARLAERLAAG
jgi:hypothetical protein